MEQRETKNKLRNVRLLSWFLAVVMILTMAAPAGAASLSEGVSEEAVQETDEDTMALILEDEEAEAAEDSEDEDALTLEDSQEISLYFYNNSGSQRYTELTVLAKEGDKIKLPEVPAEKNEEEEEIPSLGWSSKMLSTEAEYEAGEEIEVTEELHLYAAFEEIPVQPDVKNVTVQFFDENGENEYTEYQVTVPEGTSIMMPSPEERDNLRAMGWSETMNAKSASYRVGKELTVTEDMKLYSVHQKLYTITFLSNTGKTTDRLKALTIKGVWKEKVTLPDLPSYSGYISDGWTNQKNKKTVTNKEGSTYTIIGNRTLYQVNHKAKTYTVKFYDNAGKTSSSLNKLAKKVTEGKSITLPSLPAKSGYERLGWSTKKKATTASYKAGSSLKVTKNMSLYAVYQKVTYCTVQFYNQAGTKTYSSLKETVKKGDYITLPDLPAVTGYRALGWGKSKKATTSQLYDEQQRIRVTANMKLYANYKKSASTIRFYTCDGSSEYTSIRMENASTSAVMPTAFSPKGYTFLGWSTKKNQTECPQYEMGQKYSNLSSSMKLYAVCKKKSEIESENAELAVEVSQKYDEVFFIGDSRFYGMKKTLNEKYGGVPDNVTFLCQSGRGIAWFTANYTSGEKFYQQIRDAKGKKAVIWNLGINDLIDGYNDVSQSIEDYTEMMTKMARDLRGQGCDFYFMSVNPTNDKEAASPNYGTAYAPRSPYSVRLFNYQVRQNVSAYYTYIDTYTYLTSTGFILYDGLHYGDSTYLKIYDKAIESIDQR